MAKYKVWVRCAVCGDAHPMRGIVDLKGGPVKKANLTQAYGGKAIPPQIQGFMERGTTCPKCGLQFCPRTEYVLLVPE